MILLMHIIRLAFTLASTLAVSMAKLCLVSGSFKLDLLWAYLQADELWVARYILEVLFSKDEVVFLLARVIGLLGPIDYDMLERGNETSKYFTVEFDLYRINEETNEMEYITPQETSLEERVQVSDTLLLDFIGNLLEINQRRRPTAREALKDPWLLFPYG